MKSRLSLPYLLLLLSALLSSACASDGEEAPQPVITSAISGLVSPAGAAVRVTAVGSDGHSYSATPDSAGRYTIGGLPPGTYQVSASPLGRFRVRQPVQATLTTNGFPVKADSLVLTLRSRIISGTMTWTTDGQTYTATKVTGSTDELLAQRLALTGTTAPVVYPQTYPEVQLQLLAAYRGLGTYPLSGSPGLAHYHLFGFYPPSSHALLAEYYSLPMGGTLTITSYDTTQGLLSGSFGFEARTSDLPSGPQTVRVTNGSFDVRF
jgi:hypothetical protein